MDAFIAAVDDARRRQGLAEGRDLSMSEIIRRAGYTPKERAGVFYHFDRKKQWRKGHKVPPELVARLTGPRQDGASGPVLPISHEELARAAHLAAGYNVEVVGGDLPTAYARFLGDHEVTEEEKREVTARLLQIIADEHIRASAE